MGDSLIRCAKCGQECGSWPLCFECAAKADKAERAVRDAVGTLDRLAGLAKHYSQSAEALPRCDWAVLAVETAELAGRLRGEKLKVASPDPRPDKPPLGIMPEHLWKERRVWDLIACLARYRPPDWLTVAHRTMPASAWLDELRRRLNDLLPETHSAVSPAWKFAPREHPCLNCKYWLLSGPAAELGAGMCTRADVPCHDFSCFRPKEA